MEKERATPEIKAGENPNEDANDEDGDRNDEISWKSTPERCPESQNPILGNSARTHSPSKKALMLETKTLWLCLGLPLNRVA